MAHVGENDPVVPCAAISDEVANLLVDGFDLFGFSPIRGRVDRMIVVPSMLSKSFSTRIFIRVPAE
jgi:hypothetical protein